MCSSNSRRRDGSRSFKTSAASSAGISSRISAARSSSIVCSARTWTPSSASAKASAAVSTSRSCKTSLRSEGASWLRMSPMSAGCIFASLSWLNLSLIGSPALCVGSEPTIVPLDKMRAAAVSGFAEQALHAVHGVFEPHPAHQAAGRQYRRPAKRASFYRARSPGECR